MLAFHHRLEIEVQTVAKDPSSIKGSHLEAALYLQDPTTPSNVRLVKETRCLPQALQYCSLLFPFSIIKTVRAGVHGIVKVYIWV